MPAYLRIAGDREPGNAGPSPNGGNFLPHLFQQALNSVVKC